MGYNNSEQYGTSGPYDPYTKTQSIDTSNKPYDPVISKPKETKAAKKDDTDSDESSGDSDLDSDDSEDRKKKEKRRKRKEKKQKQKEQ